MSEPVLESGNCKACSAHWSWSGTGWIWSIRFHGRGQFIRATGTIQREPPAPLKRCPECGARLRAEGAARVEEVRE